MPYIGELLKRRVSERLGIAGWDTFKANAKKWSEINIPVDH